MGETTGEAPDAKTEQIPTGGAPEAPAEEVAAAVEPASPAPPAPRKDRDWKLLALFAVSCVAVFLLVATIVLAVTGDFGGHGKFGFDGSKRQYTDRVPGQGPDWRRGPGLDGDGQVPRLRRQLPDQSSPQPDTSSEPAPGVQTTPGQGSII